MRDRIFIGLTLTLGMVIGAFADESAKPEAPAASANEAVIVDPPRDSFIILPLHVHVLQSKAEEDLNCALSDDDVHRIVGKMNGVWHRAGIHWRIASLAREEACNVAAFAAIKSKATALHRTVPLEAFAPTAPPESQKEPGLHVYYIHQFAVNGVYLGERSCFVKETAQLQPVKGGIDEPIPRVSSHELGHALGLPHRQDTFNLMASGTTGTGLSRAEIETAREKAKHVSGAMTTGECETAVAKEGDAKPSDEEVKSMKEALKELPKS